MNNFDNPPPQQYLPEEQRSSPNEIVCPYLQLTEDTRRIIEGTQFEDLPNNFFLDPQIAFLFSKIRVAVNQDLEDQKQPSRLLEEAKQRIREFMEENPDDPYSLSQSDLEPKAEEIRSREFSLKMYRVNKQIILGQFRRGMENAIKNEKRSDGIDDALTIADLHTHPRPSPFSRPDLAQMLINEPNNPTQCIYMVAGGDLNVVAVVASDATKKSESELMSEFNLKQRTADYFEELDALLPEIEDKVPVEGRRLFVLQFVDLINKSTPNKVGIYVAKASEPAAPFRRIQTLEEIIDLANEVV